MLRTGFIVSLITISLLLSGCGKKGGETAGGVQLSEDILAAPKDSKDESWRKYCGLLSAQYQAQTQGQLIPYYLPRASMEPDQKDNLTASKYSRQMEVVNLAVQRTVLPGNMLVFCSPDSKTMADLVVEAFADAPKDALKDSKVLFIGKTDDSERVKIAVEAAGAQLVFVEAK
ncbi:MAG: hypothetical protein ABI644_04000 [Arenimonas sp.]